MPSRLLRAALASLLVVLAAELAPGARAAGEVAESIVGVVDSMPVLLSETRLMARLKGIDLIRAREALVDELLMHREAARLPQASVSPAELRGIVEALTGAHPGLVEEAGEQGVARLARRQACIVRYVEFRFRPQIRIADETVHREWQTTKGTATEAPTVEEYADLRAELERKELDARVEAWVAELRRQARLRYNPMPEPKP